MGKNYKIGDRIFYEYEDGSIGSALVIDIEPKTYDGNGEVKYNMLVTWRSENGHVSTAIEDYNTLGKSHPKVKEFIREKRDEITKKLNDLYKKTGAESDEEKEFVRKTMVWMSQNDVEEIIKYADL